MSVAYVASLWTLAGHGGRREWSLARRIVAAAEARFEGVIGSLTPTHARLAGKNGLRHLVGFLAERTAADAETALRAQITAGAHSVNVLLGNPRMPSAVAARIWQRLESVAQSAGVVISLETLRDRCTETPEKIRAWRIHRRRTGRSGRTVRRWWQWRLC